MLGVGTEIFLNRSRGKHYVYVMDNAKQH